MFFRITIILCFLWLIEYIGIQMFNKLIFRIGIPIFRENILLTMPGKLMRKNYIYKHTEGKFKFINNSECLFTSKFHFLSLYQINTYFPFMSIVKWNANFAVIISKIPLFATILILSVIGICVYLSINNISNVVFLIIFILLHGFCFFIERLRLRKKIKELESIISTT
ncbi:MAG: hypothetical protein KAT74_06925 [Candidatus Cloacimonetes bacterium]|nr:hypothetical protein [Candidatus Cloacimonadota bacterium]